jgi:dihydroorotate dehydrogenase
MRIDFNKANYPMALLPYALARPFLFGLDAETAHDLTMTSLASTQHTLLSLAYRSTRVDDPIELAGLKFPNRVGLAAGLDKNARCIDGLAAMGFGFVEVGTVTPRPQAGNPKPRVFRLPKANALINRLGLNNDGLDTFTANVQRASFRNTKSLGDKLPMLLGLNIGKNANTPMANATDDYLTCLDGVYAHADYVTINISSPNTKNLRDLQADEALDSLLAAMAERRELLAQKHGRRVPFFVKIAPDLNDAQIGVIADTMQRYAAMDAAASSLGWGLLATNTTISREAVTGLPHATETGGLSGTPVLSASNRVITQLRKALGKQFPIIGVGGILSAEEAVSKIVAGADVVQIYTGLIYKGPNLVGQSALAIKKQFA